MKFKQYRKGHLNGCKVMGDKPDNFIISFLRYFIFNDIDRYFRCKILIHKATFRFHKDLYEKNKILDKDLNDIYKLLEETKK